MLSRAAFNSFCGSLPASHHVVQWGGADVWKVGAKVFAIAGWHADRDAYTFKVTPLAFEVLCASPGIRPAPYMASRGLKWVQVFDDPGLCDLSLKDHLRQSYDLVCAGLTRKVRKDLGL
ncbi:MAG: MmcQ/YjbR family DNA-binding protein [Pseudomonadota bacterium]